MSRFSFSPKPYAEKTWLRVKNALLHLNFIKLVFKICIYTACSIGCGLQCITILSIYSSFPTTVYVFVQNMETLETPGITLCNNNRLVLSRLKVFNESFSQHWDQLIAAATGNDVNDTEINLKRQKLIDDNLRHLIAVLPVKTFMSLGTTHDEFIDYLFLKCASDEINPEKQCRSFANIITTSQVVGNCFTLFHRSYKKLSSDVSIRAGFSQSPVLKGSSNQSVDIELAERPFRPNEIVRIKINFTAKEYTALNDPVSGSIIIHDPNTAPTVRVKSLTISPGYYYEFFLTKQTSMLLPLPYATDCMSYSKKYKKYYESSRNGNEENDDMIYKYPFSKEDCIVGCMGEKTMKRCKCWPPELPFVSSSNSKRNRDSTKWCNWDTDHGLNLTLIDGQETSWFNYCFSVHEDSCNKLCKLDCRVDRYSVKKEFRVWPSIERIEHSKRRQFLSEENKCCAIVSIRYWSTENTIYKYKPKFEPIELVSYLSGLVSMWLGFSILGLLRSIEDMVHKTKEFIKKKRYGNKLSPGLSRAGNWERSRAILSSLRRDLKGHRERPPHLVGFPAYSPQGLYEKRKELRIPVPKHRIYP